MTIRTFLSKYQPLREGEGVNGGGDGGAAAAAAAAANTKPWYTGIDAETIGHWDNKGWKKDDAKEIAMAATKQARELERHFGVPADQLLKLPKADAKPEELKAFYKRLGAPDDAKEYDFTTVKYKGGALDANLETAMRDAMARAFVPKDRATGIAADIAKALESAEMQSATVNAGKIAEQKAELDKNWGVNKDFNRLKAMEGARRLGIAPEAIQALENMIGYPAVMEAMRKIGVGTSEDTFVERGAGSGGHPTTLEGARARLTELEGDKAWATKLKAKDAATVAEWTALTTQISNAA